MQQITVHANAKINLALDVLNRRPDGYHTVRMVMQSLSLCDTLTIQKKEAPGITIAAKNAAQYPDITWDEGNLIYKAAKLFLSAYDIAQGVHICVDKQIPAAAGLAGGSSDAAAVLHGMNQLFEKNISLEELQTLGVQLGADVPYCLMLGTALAEGIGEKLTALSPAPALYCTLVKPEQGISTKYVYEHLNLAQAKHPKIDTVLEAIEIEHILNLCQNLDNILEPVARTICPEISSIEKELLARGAIGACMSGSGPTVFGLFTDGNKAAGAAEYFSEHGYSGRAIATKFYQP